MYCNPSDTNKDNTMKINAGKIGSFLRFFFMAVLFLALCCRTAAYAQNVTADSKESPGLLSPLKVDLIFVLDNSGSMIRNDPQFITRQAVIDYLKNIRNDFRIGMVLFDKDARLVEPLTAVTTSELKAKILNKLGQINYKGQFTNTPAGVERAIYELKDDGREDARKVIVLLTDGIVDTGNKDQDLEGEKWLKEDLAMECKKAGIRIFGVAFTDNADFRLLQSLAIQTDGEYFRAYTTADIQTVFNKVDRIIVTPVETVKETAPEEVAAPESVVIEKLAPIELPDTPVQPEPDERGLMAFSLPLAGLVIIVIIFACLVFMRKKKDVLIKADAFKSVHSGYQEDDLPPMPAELIDANNIITDTSLSLSLPLDRKVARIGRDVTNEIVIPRKSVSSFHATIEFKNGYYYLEDHRSTNGTKLNEELIRQNTSIRLKSGDTIHFADCEFRFLVPDVAPYGETVMIKRNALK
jgi:uncharacterized protein YegL